MYREIRCCVTPRLGRMPGRERRHDGTNFVAILDHPRSGRIRDRAFAAIHFDLAGDRRRSKLEAGFLGDGADHAGAQWGGRSELAGPE
jgi:hypothetical protein